VGERRPPMRRNHGKEVAHGEKTQSRGGSIDGGAIVTDGLEAGLAQARAAAGDKDVGIWGGANVIT
jgi:hypothetical protein